MQKEQPTYFEASFEGFGYREMDLAADLLKAYANNPSAAGENLHNSDTIKIGMNANSGMVFITNDDGYVAIMENNEDGTPTLKPWTTCDECNAEGTRSSIEHSANCKMPIE